MSYRTLVRLLIATGASAFAWMLTGVSGAYASIAPEPRDGAVSGAYTAASSGSSTVQLILVVTLTCLVTVAATLAVQAMLRRSHHGQEIAHV